MSVEIEKGVPIPSTVKVGDQKRVYPFNKMKKGDSIWSEKIANVRSSLWSYMKKHPAQNFVSQKEEKDKVPGLRVWRIK